MGVEKGALLPAGALSGQGRLESCFWFFFFPFLPAFPPPCLIHSFDLGLIGTGTLIGNRQTKVLNKWSIHICGMNEGWKVCKLNERRE